LNGDGDVPKFGLEEVEKIKIPAAAEIQPLAVHYTDLAHLNNDRLISFKYEYIFVFQ
jgi:hypothetical protein